MNYNMKIKNLLFAAAAAVMTVAGCVEPVDFGPDKVEITSGTSLEIPVDGGSVTVEFTATVDWALQGYDEVASWLSITPEAGKASADKQTLTITAKKNDGSDREANLVIFGNVLTKASFSVSQKGGKIEDGTLAHPYSPATAAAMYNEGKLTADVKVYVGGIISEFKGEFPAKYNSVDAYISEDGSAAGKLLIYHGKNFGGAEFKGNELKVGDAVVFYGKMGEYNGEAQMAAGGVLVSLNGKVDENHEGEGGGNPGGSVGTPAGDGTEASPYNVAGITKKYQESGEGEDIVYVSGTISEFKGDFPAKYNSADIYISDDGSTAGQFFIFHGKNFGGAEFAAGDLKLGDKVIFKGKIKEYNGSPQLGSGELVSLNGKTEGGNTGGGNEGGDTPTAPETYPDSEPSATPISIKDFLAKPVNYTDWYELTGKITSIEKEDYGNFYMEDETGSVYVYGLTSKWIGAKNDKSFSQIGLKVGDKVTLKTLRQEYSGSPQAGGSWCAAWYVSHEVGEGPAPDPTGSITLKFPDDNKANNKVNGYDEPWTAKSGSYEFTMTAFNNFDWKDWTYVRCGRKKASVASIATATALPKIASVKVTNDKITTTDINSYTLAVYSDASLSSKVGGNIEAKDGIKQGEMVFEIPASSQNANQYYVLTLDCKASSADKNGFVQISKVVYVAAE